MKVIEKDSIVHDENFVEFMVNIKALGFVLKQDPEGIDLVPQKDHRIFLKLNRNFPYPGGVDFSFLTNIFHPNIHPVELSKGEKGTGYICLNVLKKWTRLSDLESTVKALRMLIENPNPDDPLNYPICKEASEFFGKNTMNDLRTQYHIEEEEEKEKKDEDIIIVDE